MIHIYMYIYVCALFLTLTHCCIYLFIFGQAWSSSPHAGFLQLQQAGAALQLRCMGFSLWWLLLLQSIGSRHMRFSVAACSLSSCDCCLWGLRASVAVAQGLVSCGRQALEQVGFSVVCMNLLALWHVESSQTRDSTHVPCIDQSIHIHSITKEIPLK